MANQTVPAFQSQRPPSLAPDLVEKEKLSGLLIKSWVVVEEEEEGWGKRWRRSCVKGRRTMRRKGKWSRRRRWRKRRRWKRRRERWRKDVEGWGRCGEVNEVEEMRRRRSEER